MSRKLVINHDRVLSHYVELHKGDSIEFTYRNSWWSKRDQHSDWEGVLSANHKNGYKTYLSNHFIQNLFECVDIEVPHDRTFDEMFAKLEEVFNDETIPYRNIYKKENDNV